MDLAAQRHGLLCRVRGDGERLLDTDQLSGVHLLDGFCLAHILEILLELRLELRKPRTKSVVRIRGHVSLSGDVRCLQALCRGCGSASATSVTKRSYGTRSAK